MVWKMLAVACVAFAFTASARAECGGDHGTTVSSEATTPDAPSKMAASTGGSSGTEQAGAGQATRQ